MRKLYHIERNDGYPDKFTVAHEGTEATTPENWKKVVVLEDDGDVQIVAKLKDDTTEVLTGRAVTA